MRLVDEETLCVEAKKMRLNAFIDEVKTLFWQGYFTALGKRAALDARTPADRYVDDPVGRASETLNKHIAELKPVWLADIEAGKGE